MGLVLPIELADECALAGFPHGEYVLVGVVNVLFTTYQIGFPGTPLERGDARTLDFKHDFLLCDVDYVNAFFINYGEKATCQWRELSDFGCRILGEVLLARELLDLLVLVIAVEAI